MTLHERIAAAATAGQLRREEARRLARMIDGERIVAPPGRAAEVAREALAAAGIEAEVAERSAAPASPRDARPREAGPDSAAGRGPERRRKRRSTAEQPETTPEAEAPGPGDQAKRTAPSEPDPVAAAIEAAIERGDLPPAARRWAQTPAGAVIVPKAHVGAEDVLEDLGIRAVPSGGWTMREDGALDVADDSRSKPADQAQDPAPRSAIARSRVAAAWAEKEPAAAARLLSDHPGAVFDLLDPDAAEAHGDKLRDLLEARPAEALGTRHDPLPNDPESGQKRLLDLAKQLPSTVEDELSVLAAARERFGKWRGDGAILPATAAGAPRIRTIETAEDRLPVPAEPGPLEPTGQKRLWTPKVPDAGPAFLLLLLFDRAGGASMDRRSREIAERLMIEALLWSSPAIRDGADDVIRPTVAEVCAALWPRSNFSKRQKIEKLRRGLGLLDRLSLSYMGGAWRPVIPRWIPPFNLEDLTEPLPLWIGLPPGSDRGPWIHRPTLRQLTGLKWRAHLGLAALRDRYGSDGGRQPWRKRGRLIPFPKLSPADRRVMVYGPDEAITRQARHARQKRADTILEAGDDRIEMVPDRADPRLWIPRWRNR